MSTFESWLEDALFPFARATMPHAHEALIIPCACRMPEASRPAPGWQLFRHGHLCAQVPFGAHSRHLGHSAHATLTQARLAPSVWQGLVAHLQEFDRPLRHTGLDYDILVFHSEDGMDVDLAARSRSIREITSIPWSNRAHWDLVRTRLQDHIDSHHPL